MTRSRMIVLLLSVIAFGAGLSVGQLWHKRPATPPEPRGPSWLSAELSLSDEQRQALLKIWDGMNDSGFEEGRRRRDLQRERNSAIRELIPQDKQAQVEQIDQRYSQQMSEMSQQRRQRFEDAMARTRAVLTPAQLEKYERLLQRREGERRRPPGGRGGPGGEMMRPGQDAPPPGGPRGPRGDRGNWEDRPGAGDVTPPKPDDAPTTASE